MRTCSARLGFDSRWHPSSRRDPQFWLNLQAQCDIEVIQRDQGAQLAEEMHALAA